MLEVQNITKSFGGVQAIKGSHFVVEKNKVTALIGPNGAGKTTLFDIIGGFIPADSGEIFLNHKNINTLLPHERAVLGISRTFQQVRLFRYLTILDHLAMAESQEDIHLLKNIFKPRFIERAPYEKALSDFGIKRSLDTLVSDLSYGQRKLLQIAMALRRPHQLLMLDEPVAGVNSVVQEQIENILFDLKAIGETILLIDHDMNFVRRLSDHVICLDAGVVIAEGKPDEVLNNPTVMEAYLGV